MLVRTQKQVIMKWAGKYQEWFLLKFYAKAVFQ